MNIRLFSLMLLLVLTGGCTPYSKIKEQPPALASLPSSAVAGFKDWRGIDKQPLAAMGSFLAAADTAAALLQVSPKNGPALQDYNAALNGFFTVLRSAKINAWEQSLRVPAPGGFYEVTARIDRAHADRHPRLYDYVPSANLELGGSYIKERTIKPGLGAALVAVRREARPDARERFSLDRAYYGVTAVARFSGRRCEFEFADPLAAEDVTLGRRSWPLAADFTAPLATMLQASDVRRNEIRNLLRPGDPAESARLTRLQGYDPNKTTVIVVHGLASSSATWVPMLNALRGDPDIRRRFQFWIFEYPSGCPYPYSAAILRRELDAAFKIYPQRRPVIFMGHSMGGLISRLMVTDSGDRLWRKLLTKPPQQLPLPAEKKRILTESLVFSARPEAGRVIFICSPHRGSNIAAGWIGRVADKLIRLPKTLVMQSLAIVTFAAEPAREIAKRAPNSVDTLSPENPFVKAAADIPMKKGMPYHSIIGDRGKGDTPNSSDGVVPYWSSHLDGAASELIVPAGHTAHQSPMAIGEVMRILHRHH